MKSQITVSFLFSLFCLPTLLLASSAGVEEMVGEIDISYQKFVLDNGLTLIVHEDHKVPIVAVNVWYHVGSKNENPGRSGSPTCLNISCSTAVNTSTRITLRHWNGWEPPT